MMKTFIAATTALLVVAVPADARLAGEPVRALSEETTALEWELAASMSYASAKPGSGGDVASRSSRSGKSFKSTPILNGFYSGRDIEDGSPQTLVILCGKNDLCNVTLGDARFSTCDAIVPTPNSGVGIATNVPIDSIGDFDIHLYCLQPDEDTVDFSNGPTTTLKGDIEILPGGGLRRTATGFFYAAGSINDDATGNINDKKVNLNGRYVGVDVNDGSSQALDILCTQEACDINLDDFSFSTCKALKGKDFFSGFGVAKNVSRTSLDDFTIELYCLNEGELEVDIYDPSRLPNGNLTGNLAFLQGGTLERTLKQTGPSFIYNKVSDTTSEEFSVYKDISQQFLALDTEDGSLSQLNLECKAGRCDIILQDSSFSTCIKKIGIDVYLGGMAIARDISQDSLHDFELDLYCVDSFESIGKINYTAPLAKLKGNMIFMQSGIVKRTVPNFTYFNIFKRDYKSHAFSLFADNTALYYNGVRFIDGGRNIIETLCSEGSCEVIVWTEIYPKCFGPSGGRLFLNGITYNSSVPEESLEDFELGLYCVPPGPGSIIDYETQDPVEVIKVSIRPGSPRGIVRYEADDDLQTANMYKLHT